MLEWVLIDETVEGLCECARDFAWSPGTQADPPGLPRLGGQSAAPICGGPHWQKGQVAATAWIWCPATTARTAWARRKTRASLVCLSTVSQVVSASTRKWLLRGRITLLLGAQATYRTRDTW